MSEGPQKLFVESVQLLDGQFSLLNYHQSRIDRTIAYHFPNSQGISIATSLHQSAIPQQGLFKCRVIYNSQIQQTEFQPYTPIFVGSLKVIECDYCNYNFKFRDRDALEQLYTMRGMCDDIIIIKNGFVTDSFNANIIFWDGIRWITSNTPLLRGTMRQKLIDDKIIAEATISVDDLKSFQKAKLVNAMVGFNGPEIDVSEIVF